MTRNLPASFERRPLPAVLVAAAMAAGLLAGTARAQEPVEVNRVVLRVNDRIATLHDYLRHRTERVAAITRAEMSDETKQQLLADVGRDTLRTIFEELLLESRAEQLGLEATPEEIREAIENAKQGFGLETEEQFEQALRQSGMTRDDLREQFRGTIRMQKVIGREVQPRIALEEEDLRRYYRANPDEFEEPTRLTLREIVFLEASGRPLDELEGEARRLREKLLSGEPVDEDVESLASLGLATSWIELGRVEAGELAPELESAVWDLEVGAVSEPVAARGGLHLLQVMERQERRTLEFNEVKDQIRLTLGEQVYGEELAGYLNELEETAYIVAQPPPEAAAFREGRPELPVDPLRKLDEALSAPAAPPPPEPGAGG